MAMSLRSYLNKKLKEKGMTVAQAKKNAGKYKSIAAAKKAGSLYYTDKNGKIQAAVYAEDLKTSSLRPKARPKTEPKVATSATQPKVTTRTLSDTRGGRGDGTMERNKRLLDPKSPQNKAKTKTSSKSKAASLPKPRATELRLSTKNLAKFNKDPNSLTRIEKSRLKKTLKRAGIKIPKGL